jgi:AcrR family transcriptional regulator
MLRPAAAYSDVMATLRAAQKAMTRKLLLETALSLFIEQGYATTTIDQIAQKAGTTRVTFYAHFASRSELMRTLIDENLNAELARTSSSSHGSTAQELVDVVRDGNPERIGRWIADTSEHWPVVEPILRTAREAAVIDPELSTLVDRWMEEAISDITEGLELADRFDPQTRHYRGVLAMAQFDYTAQHWPAPAWKIKREQMFEILTSSWVALLCD